MHIWFSIFCRSLILIFFINPLYVFAKENAILISVDTLRADHLGCYGYFRNTSPNIDKLAKEGILFEQAISQSGATLPSHASIFTSKYPFVHGADTITTIAALDDINITLAEILKSNSYRTSAFTGGSHIKKEFGIGQGFELYYDEGDFNTPLSSFAMTVPLALDWLKENKDSNFFLFLHGYDVHTPYYYPAAFENIFDPNYKGIVDRMDLTWKGLTRVYKNKYISEDGKLIKLSSKDINHIIAHYDGGIRYADEKIGEFLEGIKKLGILDSTIIILLGDHGEDLFEHNHAGKHVCNYDEVLHVPLIIRHPKIKGPKRIKTQAQLIDVMPTILDFLGISLGNSNEMQGRSLVPLIEGTASPDFNEYVYSNSSVNGVVRSKKWKLIGKYELYDLENDPKEQYNVINRYPEIALNYLQKLFAWMLRDEELVVCRKINSKNEKNQTTTGVREIIKNGYW